jgi:hypothetical protein
MGSLTPPRVGLLVAVLVALASCGEPPSPPPKKRAGYDLEHIVDEVVGGIRQRTVLSPTYPLAANRIGQMPEPFRIRPFHLQERVFITAWSSTTEDRKGTRDPDDIHCHSTISDEPIQPGQSQIWSGICTDGFTPRFVLPEGFGVVVPPGASYIFYPMFNNRRPQPRFSRMRVVIDYLTESEAGGRLKELRAFTVSAVRPEFYTAPPRAEDIKTRTFEMPFSGRVHAIGAHLHPYGESVALARESDQLMLFEAQMGPATEPGGRRLSTYASQEGFYVEQGRPYRITGRYVNDSAEPADAMAGLFIFYDPAGKPD